MRVETKRHNDRIGRHHKFAAGDRRRAAAALCVRFAKPGTQKTRAADPAALAELKGDRLNIEFKVRPLFAGVFDLFFDPGMLASSRR